MYVIIGRQSGLPGMHAMRHDHRQVNRKERMHERIWYVTLALKSRVRRERGQTLIEYAVLLAFIAIVVVTAVLAFGTALRDYWQNIVNMFP
jgi:Flp pilus assembly pilin Flp